MTEDRFQGHAVIAFLREQLDVAVGLLPVEFPDRPEQRLVEVGQSHLLGECRKSWKQKRRKTVEGTLIVNILAVALFSTQKKCVFEIEMNVGQSEGTKL